MLSRLTPSLIRPARNISSIRRISDLVSTIKTEHSDFKDQYHRITSATSLDEKKRWQNEFTANVTVHALAEELVVFPAMEKYVEGGRELADKDRAETQEVCEGFPLAPLSSSPRRQYSTSRSHLMHTSALSRIPGLHSLTEVVYRSYGHRI
jgi:hypothetical protein